MGCRGQRFGLSSAPESRRMSKPRQSADRARCAAKQPSRSYGREPESMRSKGSQCRRKEDNTTGGAERSKSHNHSSARSLGAALRKRVRRHSKVCLATAEPAPRIGTAFANTRLATTSAAVRSVAGTGTKDKPKSKRCVSYHGGTADPGKTQRGSTITVDQCCCKRRQPKRTSKRSGKEST
eukprot:5247807-Amphidinium_carterae.1